MVMRVNFLMQVNGFFYYVTSDSWIYPYRDAGQFSDASQRIFLPRHHIMMWVNFLTKSTGFCLLRHYSRVYPYRDAGQFSDASQLLFLLCHYSHIVMRVDFLMQVNGFLFTTSPFLDVPIS